MYVRTFNWTSPWFSGKGPGKFSLYVDGKRVGEVLGDEGNTWGWQKAGQVRINKSEVEIRLRDLTGFNGRCDAVFFTTDKKWCHQRTFINWMYLGKTYLVVVGMRKF